MRLRGNPAGFEFYKLEINKLREMPNLPDSERYLSGAQFASPSDFTGLLALILVAVAIARTCEGIGYADGTAYDTDKMDALVQQARHIYAVFRRATHP